jgi:hypothetical protein
MPTLAQRSTSIRWTRLRCRPVAAAARLGTDRGHRQRTSPLEKDRNRRYETAKDFAADVQRYLNDEPVEACPPSAGYRLRKFARRNKRPVLAALLVLVVLVAGVIDTTWMPRKT